jgi:hypothetical protein
MNADEIQAAARKAAEASATSQGLPVCIIDQTALKRVAALLTTLASGDA